MNSVNRKDAMILNACLSALMAASSSGWTRAVQNPTPSPAQAQQAASVPARIDPKAQALLDGAIKALGGPAFLNFKRQTTRGRSFAIADEATAGLAQFQSYIEFPDKRRFSYGKKNPVVLINNADRAIEIDKYGMTHQLPSQIERWKLFIRYGMENLLRISIHQPGLLIQTAGVDFVDNVPTQGVEITEPGGSTVRLDLHKQTLLPVRISYRVQNPKTREWDEYADVYGDYREYQGVMTPLHITRFLNDERVGETFRNYVKYDEDYPPNYFQLGG